MTERQRDEFRERKLEILRTRMYCEVCEARGVLRPGLYLAHRAAKTKRALKDWGAAVIHHDRNVALVCGSKCNDAVLVNGLERQRLLESIKEELENE